MKNGSYFPHHMLAASFKEQNKFAQKSNETENSGGIQVYGSKLADIEVSYL